MFAAVAMPVILVAGRASYLLRRPSAVVERPEMLCVWSFQLSAPVETAERYLGCKRRIRGAVNDQIGVEPDHVSAPRRTLPPARSPRRSRKAPVPER